MRLKENFILRQVAGSWVVVAVGTACADFDGMLSLNDSGALLWKGLERGSDRAGLVRALTGTYDVPEEQAGRDVDVFLATLRQAGCLTE